MLRNLLQKLSGLTGGRRPGGDVSGLGIALFVMVALVAWVISGFYTIKEAERGVVLRFDARILPKCGACDFHRWKATLSDQVIPVDVESVRSLPAAGFMLTRSRMW